MNRMLRWTSAVCVGILVAFLVSCQSAEQQAKDRDADRHLEIVKGFQAPDPAVDKATARQQAKEKAIQEKADSEAKEKQRKAAEADRQKGIQRVTLTIATDKTDYTLGEPLALTVNYKNNGADRVRLIGDGHSAKDGFSGELIVLTRRDFTDPYRFLPLDLEPEEHVVFPKEAWTRTIKDLGATLQQAGVNSDRTPVSAVPAQKPAADETPAEGAAPAAGATPAETAPAAAATAEPLRFEKPGKYTIQVTYYPNRMPRTLAGEEKDKGKTKMAQPEATATYAGPDVVTQPLASNIVRITVQSPAEPAATPAPATPPPAKKDAAPAAKKDAAK